MAYRVLLWNHYQSDLGQVQRMIMHRNHTKRSLCFGSGHFQLIAESTGWTCATGKQYDVFDINWKLPGPYPSPLPSFLLLHTCQEACNGTSWFWCNISVPCSSVGGSTTCTRVGRSSTVLVYHSVLVTAVIRTMTSAAMILHFLTFLRLHFSGLRGSSVIHAPPPLPIKPTAHITLYVFRVNLLCYIH